jgi:hypothetical protein
MIEKVTSSNRPGIEMLENTNMTTPTISTISVEGPAGSPEFKKVVTGGGRRGRCSFKKTDVTRLIEAVEMAGAKAQRVEVNIGTTKMVVMLSPAEVLPEAGPQDTPEQILGLV